MPSLEGDLSEFLFSDTFTYNNSSIRPCYYNVDISHPSDVSGDVVVHFAFAPARIDAAVID
jgi:hypothetical protein